MFASRLNVSCRFYVERILAALCCCLAVSVTQATGAEFRGVVLDADSEMPVAARIYVRDSDGDWLFVETAASDGSAFPYSEQWVPMPDSTEKHTTVSAHPFRIELPAGTYTIRIERGKEYLPLSCAITMTDQPQHVDFRLQRFVNAAERGWYSGETHVHRRLQELPNVMMAEDLNVAFPVAFWTVRSDRPPDLEPSPLRRQGPSPFGARQDAGRNPVFVDRQHVIFPRNTEYEIFSIGDHRHVLGAVFILNHQSVFRQLVPPVRNLAEQAHREGALLDLDKHSWPWSMMLVPVANVDLFELSNNSVWRTNFGFNRVSDSIPDWMKVEYESPGVLTEWGWLQYGFECWYALLNCGFRLSPSAGTASGVHPVPLGYSRVYVQTGSSFDYEKWLTGLKAGHSFVTNGPMLFATINKEHPGTAHPFSEDGGELPIHVEVVSQFSASLVEILQNGRVVASIVPQSTVDATGASRTVIDESIAVRTSGWIAVRVIENQPDGRKRFAHSAPWYVSVQNRPMRPRREQVEYFLQLMDTEIIRNKDILPAESLAEIEQARDVYQSLLDESEP
ncbi:MAG: CehA/McbA family metallohydrolase [Planctomycetaceae bacterium]